MPQSGAIRAGRAFVELFADDSKLVGGLRRAQAKLKAFGAGVRTLGLWVGGIGTAIAAPMLAAAKSFAESGAALYDMSKRTGLSVEALSLLSYAADQTGASIEGVERGVRIMQKSIAGAADAAEGTTGKLEDLGLAAGDLVGKGPAEQFAIIASRLRGIADPTERAAAAMKVFGRSGTALLPLIDNFEKLFAEAAEFGLIRTTDSARQAKALSDAYTLMGKTIRSAWNAVGQAVAPVLMESTAWIARAATAVRDWLRRNQGLIASLFKLASLSVAVGAGLAVLGTAIARVGVVLGILIPAVKVLGAVLGLLLTPLGAVAAAAAAFGAYFLASTGRVSAAADWLRGVFETLRQDALASFAGIADALAAGDIGLAAKILWLTLKMEWRRGITPLLEMGSAWKESILRMFSDAWYGALVIARSVWTALEIGWEEMTAFLAQAWYGFADIFKRVWVSMKMFAQEVWLNIKSLFDESIDVEAETQKIRESAGREMEASKTERAQRSAAREAGRKSERERIDKEHMDRLRDLTDRARKARSDIKGQAGAEQKQTASELEQARQEWQKALAEAAERRKARELAPLKAPGEAGDLIDRLKAGVEGLGDRLESLRVSAVGTFQAEGLFGLGIASAQDRTAAATEQTAANTKKLLNEARGGGLVFG